MSSDTTSDTGASGLGTLGRREVSRRRFIGEASCAAVGSTALFSTALNLQLNAKAAAAALQPGDDYKAIVCLFLAGGNDSFNMLVPTDAENYAQYQTVRTNIALQKAGQGNTGPIRDLDFDADGRTFGVHPAMAEVQSLFNQGAMSFVANVGTLIEPLTVAQYKAESRRIPRALFSHNDQVSQWQTGYPQGNLRDGWAGRIADAINDFNVGGQVSMNISLNGNNTFQTGVGTTHYTITQNGSIALNGKTSGPNSNQFRRFSSVGFDPADATTLAGQTYQNLFEQAYMSEFSNSIETDDVFSGAFQNAALATDFDQGSALARRLEAVAKTIKSRSALGMRRQVFFVVAGGWDNHQELLANHAGLLGDVSRSMKSFWDAMGEPDVAARDDVVLFTASDFGRTLRSNGRGTDHAWGGNHMVMGGPVIGKKVFGTYPTASEFQLDAGLDVGRNGRMLPTTSVDEYAGEISRWFGVPDAALPIVLRNVRNFVPQGVNRPIGFLADTVDEPDPSTATFASSCLAENGRFDVTLVNGGPESANFDVDVTGLPRRSRNLAVGQEMTVTVTGRRDGQYTITVYRDGELLDQTAFDVSCDPIPSEVAVEHSCLSGNGRVDVWLRNDTGAQATYDASITGLTSRRQVLAPGDLQRITWTGRRDGFYTVSVDRNGAQIFTENVQIACDVQTDPVEVTNSCLAGNGRLDFDLLNDTASTATFEIAVGSLPVRSRTVAPGGTTRVTFTGRQNGQLPVSVSRNGTEIFNSPQTISC